MGLREIWIRRREEKKIRQTIEDQSRQGYSSEAISDALLNGVIESSIHFDPFVNEKHRSKRWSSLVKIRAKIFAKLYDEHQRSSRST